MRPFLIAASSTALLLLQALLFSFAVGSDDLAARASSIGNHSWRALVIYVLLAGMLGHWTSAGRASLADLETGKRLLFAVTLAGPLPLWIFLNGFLGDNLTDMLALWLLPFAVLVAGAAMTKDWRDLVRAVTIGFTFPVASLLFLATFVDFGN